jgi:GTP-binding protein Era
MIGHKVSIVSSNPQTTRNRIMGVKTTAEYQVVFVDTPGIHKPLYLMNERMAGATESALSAVDIVALLIDVTERFGSGDAFALKMLEKVRDPVFLLINKIDLVPKPKVLPFIEDYSKKFKFEEIIPLSALTGEGCDALETEILKRLPEGPQYFPEGTLTDFPEKLLAQEFIREKVLAHTRNELPYTTGVQIKRFEEASEKQILVIEAVVYVERESQKPIVIGRNASLIKQIGIEAREDLERFFHTKILLKLTVQRRDKWRNDPRFLSEMGIE